MANSTTETYPTPLDTAPEEFPTPVEAAVKGLNPNPPPLETGLSDMPELPELTHHAAHAAAAEGVKKPDVTRKTDSSEDDDTPRLSHISPRNSTSSSSADAKVIKPVNGDTKTDKLNLGRPTSSVGEKEPKYADIASRNNIKKKAKSAAKAAQTKKEELERELRAETAGRGWPSSLGEAWDRYWLVGSVVGIAAVAVGVGLAVRSRPNWAAWLRRK